MKNLPALMLEDVVAQKDRDRTVLSKFQSLVIERMRENPGSFLRRYGHFHYKLFTNNSSPLMKVPIRTVQALWDKNVLDIQSTVHPRVYVLK